MPDALPLTGLFGKVPAHGDFVRRGLPTSFVGPWDSWLQDGMATARAALGDRWAACWDGGPPWRFALPAGACGPDAVAGVMLPSEDMVGRRFPITLAVLLPPGAPMPAPAWFAALEAAALAGRAGRADADALAAAIPLPGDELPEPVAFAASAGWGPAEALPFATATDGDAAPPVGDVLDTAVGLPLVVEAMDVPDGDAVAAAGNSVEVLAAGTPAPESTIGVLDLAGGPIAAEPADPLEGEARGTDGSLLGLFGTDRAAPANDPPATDPAPSGDVLDFFSRGLLPAEATAMPQPGVGMAAPHMATPDAAPEPATPDGTLAFLLGESGAAPAASEPGSVGDPLAALIAAGDGLLVSSTGIDAPEPTQTVPILADFDPLPPAAAPAPLPPAAAPAPLPPAVAPAPPENGGWWTGGGGRLPPAARPLPALIPPVVFASLLEADA